MRCTGILFSAFSMTRTTNITAADIVSGIIRFRRLRPLMVDRIPSKRLTTISIVRPPIPYFAFLSDSHKITITPVTICTVTVVLMRSERSPVPLNLN